MVKNVKIMIQNDLRERLTFPIGEGNLYRKSFWIKRLILLGRIELPFLGLYKMIDKIISKKHR